jgi:hypothetical protein
MDHNRSAQGAAAASGASVALNERPQRVRTSREHLGQADKHIAECKTHIARQPEAIRKKEREGHDAHLARSVLRILEDTLTKFVALEDGLRQMTGNNGREPAVLSLRGGRPIILRLSIKQNGPMSALGGSGRATPNEVGRLWTHLGHRPDQCHPPRSEQFMPAPKTCRPTPAKLEGAATRLSRGSRGRCTLTVDA